MVEQHPRVRNLPALYSNILTHIFFFTLQCVVHSYVNWLEDSDFDPTCSLCSNSLDQGEVIRLVCYGLYDLLHVLDRGELYLFADLYHVTCLDKYASSIANGVTVVCPKCQVCA